MKALAIDTSNTTMGVAVIDGEHILGEIITNLKKNHSVRLMPAIQSLLQEVDMKPNDLDRIIVAQGPGSYTGVRIGVTVSKTLAWSLEIPLVGVSSLEVLAQNGRYFDGMVVPMFDARRGQAYTGLYAVKDGVFQNVQRDRITLLTDWLKELQQSSEEILFLGYDVEKHAHTICDMLGEQAVFAPSSMCSPRSGAQALLGVQCSPTRNVHAFVPQYLQLAEAESTWRKAQK